MKVEELLSIVASQACVFDNPKMVAISPSPLFSGITLTAEDKTIGLFNPISQFITPSQELIIKDLNSLDAVLRGFDLKDRIGWQSVGSPQFKIGFLDYDEGWVETVTSEELGLSEVENPSGLKLSAEQEAGIKKSMDNWLKALGVKKYPDKGVYSFIPPDIRREFIRRKGGK